MTVSCSITDKVFIKQQRPPVYININKDDFQQLKTVQSSQTITAFFLQIRSIYCVKVSLALLIKCKLVFVTFPGVN